MEKQIQKQIIDVIERLHNDKITTKNRKRSNVTARAVYAKLCKDIFPYLTLHKIAEPINRDHATIIHAFKMKLVTASADGTARVYNTMTGACQAILGQIFGKHPLLELLQLRSCRC